MAKLFVNTLESESYFLKYGAGRMNQGSTTTLSCVVVVSWYVLPA